MPKKQTTINQSAAYIVLLFGVLLIIFSAFYSSSFTTLLGSALIFWGMILLYIKPIKHVPLFLLNATMDPESSNIEMLLSQTSIDQTAIYLPPKNLPDAVYSLVYIPKKADDPLPKFEDTTKTFYPANNQGLILTPPGLSLSKIYEQQLGTSFIKMTIEQFQTLLPKLFVEKLEIADSVKVENLSGCITVEVGGSIFEEVRQKTEQLPHTYNQIGCILGSSIGCALSKVTGKPIFFQKEAYFPEKKLLILSYKIKEED